MRPRFDWPLVGRSRELAMVGEVLAGAAADPLAAAQRGVVFVASEGVGLTRLHRAAGELATEHGWPVVALAGSPGLQAYPLGAVASLLAEQLTDLTRSVRSLLLEAQRALIADAADGRLVVLVDDAHFLDELSASLLEQMVSRSGCLLLATIKLGSSVPEAIAGLLRQGVVERVTVSALDDDEITVLVDHCLEPKADGVTRQELVRAAQGNPLALREAIAGSFEAESLSTVEGVWMLGAPLGVAPRLGELVATHLDGLADDEMKALELLAVAQPLGANTLLSLCTPDALESLERQGLIQLDERARRPEISLAQSMFADVLRSRVGPLRRAALFRALLDAGEADWAERRGQVLRAAMFHVEAGQAADAELLFQAAHEAHMAVDPERELRMLRLAWETSNQPAVARYLSRALNLTGYAHESVTVLRDAFALELDEREVMLVGGALALTQLRSLGDREAAAESFAAMRERLPDRSMGRAVQALEGLAAQLQGDALGCLRLCEPLVQVDAQDELDWAGADAASSLARVYVFDGQPERGRAIAMKAFGFRLQTDDPRRPREAVGIHMVNNMLGVIEAGHLGEGRTIAQNFYELSVAERNVAGQSWMAAGLGRADLYSGQFLAATGWFQEGAALGRRVHDRLVQEWGLVWLALAQVWQGDLAGADETLHECTRLESFPLASERGVLQLARIWRIARAGDTGLAIEQLDELAADACATRRRGIGAAAVRDLVRLGAPERAVAHLGALEELEGELLPIWLRYAVAAHERSAADVDAVSRDLERLGAAWFASEAALEAGRAYVALGETQAAARAVRRARLLATSCDWVGEEALAVIDDVSPLRGRELEVARLAAANLSNREIADHLVVSLRTVENHLHRAFGKLGIDSRSELADLVPPA